MKLVVLHRPVAQLDEGLRASIDIYGRIAFLLDWLKGEAVQLNEVMHPYLTNAGRQALSHKLPTPPPRARLVQLTLDQPRRDLTLSWCARSVCKQNSRLIPALDRRPGDKSQLLLILCCLWRMTGDSQLTSCSHHHLLQVLPMLKMQAHFHL